MILRNGTERHPPNMLFFFELSCKNNRIQFSPHYVQILPFRKRGAWYWPLKASHFAHDLYQFFAWAKAGGGKTSFPGQQRIPAGGGKGGEEDKDEEKAEKDKEDEEEKEDMEDKEVEMKEEK